MINKRVKKWAAQSVVGCLLVSTFFGFGASVMAQDTKDAAANGYKDLNDSYAVKEIQTLSEMGILSGFDGGFFKPHDAVTRAQLAKILVMSMGLKEDASSAAGFTDVPQDAWYRGFVGALVKSGVTQGTDANQFSPEKTVTREELATFFIRSFGLEGQAAQSGTDAKLSDMSSVSDWAKADVAFAFKIGFIGGIDDGKGGVKFQPKDTAERQALARLGYEFKLNNAKYMSKAEELKKAGSGTNSGSTGSTGKDNAETTSVVSDLVATTNSTMEVIFKAPVDAVSTTDFQFDNDLTVSAASIKSSMPNVVQLTTSAQTAGQVYNLTYKGKQTGIKATGVAVRTGGSSSLPFNPSDPFAFAGTYDSDFNITSSGTYGPINGTSVINGTLTLDPGPSGEITLRNVKVSNLEVKSGAADSIHFMNVLVSGAVNINATGQDNPVHVVTEGTTSFGDLNVISPSTLDLMSSGTIGSITVNQQAAGTTLLLGTGNHVQSLNVLGNLTLNGDFSQVLVSKDSNASIATTDASAQSLLDQLLSNIKDAAQAAIELKNKLSSNELTADFDLPVLTASQAVLQWTSSSDALKIIDGVHVKVTRGETDTTVTLTVKITIGKAVQEISFTFKVKGLPGQPGMTDEQKAQADKDALNLGDLSAVTSNLTLPATGANGSVITWETSNAGVVTAAGVVTLPSSGQPDAQAVLTATITSNGYSTTKTFNITVKSLTALVKGFVYNDKHEPLSGVSVTLGTYTVATGSQGEYVISNIQPGSYSLKAELSGYESYNGEAVSLAAGQTWNVSDIALVKVTSPGMTDEQKAQADKDALNLGDLSAVTSNLTLPATGANGSVITWVTSNAGVVSAAGVVTRPAFGQPDSKAVLTATVTSNTYTTNRSFDVVVKAQSTSGLTLAEVRSKAENAVVATSGVVTTKSDTSNTFYMQDATGGVLVYSPTTKTAVVPGDQVAISSGVKTTYNGEIELTGAVFTIIGHTDVPASQVLNATEVPGKGGQLVTVKQLIVSNLSGSNFDATDLSGNVIKIYGQKYAVNYGGTIANGDIVDATGISVMFNSTVEIYPRSAADIVKQGKVSDADKVQLDKNTLNLGDVSAVYADLTLPTVGSNGSSITWTTSDTSVITAAGQVNQPAFGQQDQTVTLTANLNLNGNLATKTFEVTVKAQAISDAQAVANEAAVLYVFYDGVEANVVLADRGVDGTKVTWQLADASQASVVNVANRTVSRTALTNDAQVTLNATIARGSKSAVKSFTITVNAIKELPEVNPVSNSDSVVTGTAKAGTTVTVSTAGKTLGTATAAVSGDYIVMVDPQTAGTLLEVSASGSGYTSDSAYVLVTDTLSVSTTTPTAGESFTLSILNAKGQDGTALNGSIAINVSSSVYGSVYSAPVAFKNGSASVKLTLNQAGVHKLTVVIPGVAISPSVTVTVSQADVPATIANGGFEAWTAGKPDAWFGSTTSITTANATKTSDAHSGLSAIQLKNNSSKHVRFSSTNIQLTKDKKYTLTYWAKGSANLRNSNVALNGLAYADYTEYKTLTNEWKEYSYPFTAPSTGDFELIFSVAGDSTNFIAIIDDVTISTKP